MGDMSVKKEAPRELDPEFIRSMKTDDGKRPDESKIARLLIDKAQIITHRGKVYDLDGEVNTDDLEWTIANLLIEIGFKTNVARNTNSILELAKILSVGDIPLARDEIPLQNGTLVVGKGGEITFLPGEKHFSPYRLNCDYDPDAGDCPYFHQWMDDLFTPEDQKCFQEIMGYLLIPTTQGQKAFFLLGVGGEGKSIWGSILHRMFGNGFSPTKVAELEEDRFTVATMENKIVIYDDDMDHNKMKKTDKFKTIVTAKIPVQGERKNKDKFEFLPFARICASGNFALSSLHDTSDGFFRRLLPIRVKNRPSERKDVSDYEKLIFPEINAILLWALEGLQRLMKNDFQFSISDRSREMLSDIREEGNSMIIFIEQEVVFDHKSKVTTDALNAAYLRFCEKNGLVARGGKYGFSQYLKDRAETYGISYTKRAIGDKRGFVGMKLKRSVDLDAILGKGD